MSFSRILRFRDTLSIVIIHNAKVSVSKGDPYALDYRVPSALLIQSS